MTLLDIALIVVALAGLVQFARCMRGDISIDIMLTPEKNAEDDSLKALVDYIAELEEEQVILKDQQREAKNILIDKNLHIDSLYEEGYKLQQRIAELEAERRWVPVSERLPEDRATILAAFKNREILTATYYKRYEGFGGVENYWHIEGWHSGDVTHWMPLPQPPEVQE